MKLHSSRLPTLPLPSVFPLLPHPFLWLLPTLRKWTDLVRRNDDDSTARQPLVTSASHARSSATARCLARIASVRTRATRAHSQARNHGGRRAPQTHQHTATMMPTRSYRKLGRDATQIPNQLYAPSRMLTTLNLEPYNHLDCVVDLSLLTPPWYPIPQAQT